MFMCQEYGPKSPGNQSVLESVETRPVLMSRENTSVSYVP